MAEEAKKDMYEEVGIDQLFKVSDEITVTDEVNKKKAKVHLRILSDIEKRKASDYATAKRAELKRKLDDKNSDEAVLLDESIAKKALDAVKIEIMFSKKRSIYKDVFQAVRETKKYAEKTDDALFADEKFAEVMEKELEGAVEKYLKSLGEDEGKLKKVLRSLSIDFMLDAFYMRNYNEKMIQQALRDPKDVTKCIFNDVDSMMGSFFGTSYKQLVDSYYALVKLTDRDLKN